MRQPARLDAIEEIPGVLGGREPAGSGRRDQLAAERRRRDLDPARVARLDPAFVALEADRAGAQAGPILGPAAEGVGRKSMTSRTPLA